SRYWPGCSVIDGSTVTPLPAKLPVPVALAYCTDQPATDAGPVPRLYSSTKSLVYGAPVFPPPPYTWLITMSGETACAGAAGLMPAAAAARVTRAAYVASRLIRCVIACAPFVNGLRYLTPGIRRASLRARRGAGDRAASVVYKPCSTGYQKLTGRRS